MVAAEPRRLRLVDQVQQGPLLDPDRIGLPPGEAGAAERLRRKPAVDQGANRAMAPRARSEQGTIGLMSGEVLHAPAEIGPGGGKLRGSKANRTSSKNRVEPPVDQGHLGDLVVRPFRSENLSDRAEQVALEVAGNEGTGRPEIT